MTVYELHLYFDDALDKISSASYADIPIEQKDRYFNVAMEKFIKQRYGGNNYKRTGFEETQKRTDDLVDLVRYARIPVGPSAFYNTATVSTSWYDLPQDYWFSISERVNIQAGNCSDTNVQVKPRRHNEINSVLLDPFNKPKGNRLFRVMSGGNNRGATFGLYNSNDFLLRNSIQLFYDRTITVGDYELAYITQYVRMRGETDNQQTAITGLPYTYSTLPTPTAGIPRWNQVEFWMPSHTHIEIVDLAVKACLEAIEHPRYGSFTQESSTDE